LLEPRHGALALPFGLQAAGPDDGDVHALASALDRDHHTLHHLPDDLLALRRRRGRCVPQRWDVLGEPPNRLAFLRRQAAGLRPEKALVVFLKALLGGELLFPLAFQLPGDEPVLRLAQAILPRRALNLVPSSLVSLLPEPIQVRALALHVLRGLQGQVHGYGLECFEHLVAQDRV